MSDLSLSGTVLKADDEKRFILLVAYSANKMPLRGADGFIDVARPDVLEKACWKFMDNGAKMGLWHDSETVAKEPARVVENYIYRGPDWITECPNGDVQVIKRGDWIVGLIGTPETWAMYKAGLIGGASPEGTAGRKEASQDFVAQLRSTE